MKKWIGIITISIIAILIGVLITCIVFFKSVTSKNNIETTKELADNNNQIEYENSLEVISSNYSGVKMTPNTKIIFETYYKQCSHKEEKEEKIQETLVNSYESQLQEMYPDWTIKKFSAEEVILNKEIEGFCSEHYVLRDKDGYIGVFKVNENGEEELKELTNILVQYLSETDTLDIKDGLEVYKKENLNKILEDFE